ncbi:MAG: SLBB domain-containing protein [Ignavibacteriae bacterium]|nr:SLBB domain-containing protein [Ignavibacteriota bacterium]
MKSETKDASTISVATVPVDAPVNPSEYFVGPGDVLALNIWSSAPQSLQLTVTPEATLLIPSVGAVDVADGTLEAVKKKVANLVGKKYPNSEITLTLMAPRKIVVQVTGEVYNEGKHELNALQRVDNLIALANEPPSGLRDADVYKQVMQTRLASSLRNIIIQRKNGLRLRADVIKYMATGLGKYNPYLREGDQILVPRKYEMVLAIGVSGGVRKPGGFEFVPGDSLSDLIGMGFGFCKKSDSTHGVLTRLSSDANSMETIEVNPAAILAGVEPNIALRQGDRLVVKELPELRSSFIAAVEGEVKQAGQYPITLHSTKLSEIIRAAGGFAAEANLRGATLERARLSPHSPPEEIAREQLLSSRTNLGIQDTAYYLTETALRLKGELVSVDFHKLFVEGDTTQDVTLRNYDKIFIPKLTKTVYVFGQVLAPGHVEYVAGRDYRYYINKVAGYTDDARSGEVKIIKGSTRVWLDPSETEIEDGDYIWVPKDRSYPFAYHLNTWAQVAGIIGTVATVALLINNLTK